MKYSFPTKWLYTYYRLQNYSPTIPPFLSNQHFSNTWNHYTVVALRERLSGAFEFSWRELLKTVCVCVCVIVLIPTCNCTGEMTACVFVCMHVCKVSVRGQCRDLTQWQALGHPPTSWYVCGTLQLEPLHVTALVPSCPFTRNDWPIWGTQTHIHTQWVTSDVGLLWHFPRASSSVHS